MSNNKMKGLLKGLRYISQIFDNDKEPEMQIGYPTDVKHVAHIGWDGPSVNSPSWMNEFKSPPGFSSVPLNLPEDVKDQDNEDQVKWYSEDSASRRSARVPNSPARDLPELPRSSRRQSSTDAVIESPNREKSEKPRQSRRSSKSSLKDSSDGAKLTRQQQVPLESSPARSPPDIPKKSRRKKSKEYPTGGGGSTRSSRLKAQVSSEETYQSPFSDPGPGAGSVSASRNNELISPQSFEGGSRKGYMGGIY